VIRIGLIREHATELQPLHLLLCALNIDFDGEQGGLVVFLAGDREQVCAVGQGAVDAGDAQYDVF
jgi:hypothetical protein